MAVHLDKRAAATVLPSGAAVTVGSQSGNGLLTTSAAEV